MAVQVQQSRFALLKVEDDDDSDQDNKQNTKVVQNNAAKKKKNKKKKPSAAADDTQLRNLAFGGKLAGPPGRPQSATGHGKKGNPATDEQWKEWQKLDAELAEDAYEKDLKEAILLSKLDAEERKQVVSALGSGDSRAKATSGKENKKKKKEKNAMTLEEFNKLEIKDKTEQSDEEMIEVMPPKPKLSTEVSNPEPEFFNKVEQEVSRSIRKEKIQDEYRRQYSMENTFLAKYKEDLEKKDQEIEKLKAENEKLQHDYKEVKKRNQQLCVILSQGEMKDKKSVLLELEQLKSIQGELTQEVAQLTTDLEKERSTVRGLKDELAKVKGGKQAGR